MVGSRGIWRTGDCGKTWRQVSFVNDLLRVHFLDENVGFAVGLGKQFLRTTDGGQRWTKATVAEEPQSTVERSHYSWIDFAARQFGLVVGGHQPRVTPPTVRAPQPWLDPESQLKRRQLPSLALLLQSVDGGATWRGSSMSVLGNITRVKLGTNGKALTLVEFPHAFEWPAEVYTLNLQTGQTTRVFREKDRAVTDVAVLPGGVAYAAAVEPPGTVRQLPIPGKVRIAQSLDLVAWREVEVDYRAMAGRVWLATSPGTPIMAATDTGMVLVLARR